MYNKRCFSFTNSDISIETSVSSGSTATLNFGDCEKQQLKPKLFLFRNADRVNVSSFTDSILDEPFNPSTLDEKNLVSYSRFTP